MMDLVKLYAEAKQAFFLKKHYDDASAALGMDPYLPTMETNEWLTAAQVEKMVADNPTLNRRELGPDDFPNSLMLVAQGKADAVPVYEAEFRKEGYFRCAPNMLRFWGPFFQVAVEYPDRTVWLLDDVAELVIAMEKDAREAEE
jgi:hypothetical protein